MFLKSPWTGLKRVNNLALLRFGSETARTLIAKITFVSSCVLTLPVFNARNHRAHFENMSPLGFEVKRKYDTFKEESDRFFLPGLQG
uniref:Cytochrome c oxidase polypeptide VIa n=1 Tax=Steinernema glaseri TaxID=37863 RepID=A0A1I7ZM02_9BILA